MSKAVNTNNCLKELEAEPAEYLELFTMTINLGNGITEEVAVSKNDSPKLLASALSLKHGLTKKQEVELAAVLKSNMNYTRTPIKVKEVEKSSIKKTAATQNSSLCKLKERRNQSVEYSNSISIQDNNWQQELLERTKNKKLHYHPMIDKQSKEMVKGMRREKVPTYIRLYNYASVKQHAKSYTQEFKPKKKRYTSLNKSFNSLTNGERIYERHLLKKEQWRQKHARVRDELLSKEMQEVSFKPNLFSKKMKHNRSFINPEDRLIEFGKIAAKKKEIERNKRSARELLDCSFRPSIDSVSREIVQKKKLGSTLLNHKTILKEKSISKTSFECTFKPDISLTKKFNDALPKTIPERSRHKHSIVRENSYKPEVGRAPRIDRNLARLPIGDYLYSQAKHKHNIHKTDTKNKKTGEDKTKRRYNSVVKKEPQLLINKMKDTSYKKLFEMLDPNNKGVITSEIADITCIPSNVLSLIAPLLCDMESEGLDYNKFAEGMNELYKDMTVAEKKEILNFPKNVQKEAVYNSSIFTFKVRY